MIKWFVFLMYILHLSYLPKVAQAQVPPAAGGYTLYMAANVQKIVPETYTKGKIIADSIQCHYEIDILLKNLHQQGYLLAAMDSFWVISHIFTAKIYIGQQYFWQNISLKNIDAATIAACNLRQFFEDKNAINPENYQKICQKILLHCARTGYPFATVGLDSTTFIDNVVSGNLFINNRLKITIDSIRIAGTDKVNRQYLEKYLNLRPNTPYNATTIAAASRKLQNLPFLRITQPPKTYFYNDRAAVYIFIKDAPVNQADGIVGVFPNAQNTQKLLITGDLTLSLHNSFRRGEIFALTWKRLDASIAELKIKGSYPYLLGLPIGIEGEFRQFRKDTSQFEINQRYGVQYLLGGNNFIKIYGQKRSFTLNNTAFVNADSLRVANSIGSLYGIEWRIQQLNRAQNPTKGYMIMGAAGIGSKQIRTLKSTQTTTTQQYQIELQIQTYTTLTKRWVLANSLYAQGNFNAQIFENELFRLGGFKTLKGFEEEALRASRYVIINTEPRFLLEQNSYLFAFFNGAYMYNQFKKNTTIPIGFGLGISFTAKSGVFSLAYALGQNSGLPLLVRSSKIHFGYKYFL
jgi:outer membrane protein assembly factor BamA